MQRDRYSSTPDGYKTPKSLYAIGIAIIVIFLYLCFLILHNATRSTEETTFRLFPRNFGISIIILVILIVMAKLVYARSYRKQHREHIARLRSQGIEVEYLPGGPSHGMPAIAVITRTNASSSTVIQNQHTSYTNENFYHEAQTPYGPSTVIQPGQNDRPPPYEAAPQCATGVGPLYGPPAYPGTSYQYGNPYVAQPLHNMSDSNKNPNLPRY